MRILDEQPVSPLGLLWARIKTAVMGERWAWRWAWVRRNLPAARALKAAGASAKDLADVVFETPTGSLAEALNHAHLVQILKQSGVDPKNCIEVLSHPPALHQAARALDLTAIAALLAAGADVNASHERAGSECLYTALEVVLDRGPEGVHPERDTGEFHQNQKRAVQLLCAGGACTNALGYRHRPPLLSAPWGPLSEVLLEQGADPCALSGTGRLVFHDHLIGSNPEIFTADPDAFAHMLHLHLQQGATIDLPDEDGYPLLARVVQKLAVRGHGVAAEEIKNARTILHTLVVDFGADCAGVWGQAQNTLLHVAIDTVYGPPAWLLDWLLDRPAPQLHSLLAQRNAAGFTAWEAFQKLLSKPKHPGKGEPDLGQVASRLQSCALGLAVEPVPLVAPRSRLRL